MSDPFEYRLVYIMSVTCPFVRKYDFAVCYPPAKKLSTVS